MMCTPYGVKPALKRVLAKLKPRKGYYTLGIPLTGLDTNEEEN